jgi:hypothetical protein
LSRSGRIEGIRGRLASFGDEFWEEEMCAASVSRMEHFLSDFGAAFF